MEDKSLYRPIISRAWQITKRHKSLWFLAFFAALWSSGEMEIIIRALYYPQNNGIWANFLSGLKWGGQYGLSLAGGSLWLNAWQTITQNPLPFIISGILLILSLLIGLFIIWLSTVSQIGLIKNSSLLNQDKKTTANEGISEGVKKFWPVFGINLIFRVITLGFFIFLGQELIAMSSKGTIGFIAYALSFVIFAVFVLIVSFLVRYQFFYIILKGEKILTALKSAWNLFRVNWIISVEMALIMFGFYLVVYFLTIYITAILSAVLTSVIWLYFPLLPLWVKLIMGVVTTILMIIVLILGTCLIITFQWAGWVILFEELDGGKEKAKIYRLAQQAKNFPSYFKKN